MIRVSIESRRLPQLEKLISKQLIFKKEENVKISKWYNFNDL